MTVEAKTGNAAGPISARTSVGVRDLARLHTQSAIDVLTGIMSDVNVAAAVRAKAARALLAFGDRMRAANLAPKGRKELEGAAVGVEWAGLPEGGD